MSSPEDTSNPHPTSRAEHGATPSTDRLLAMVRRVSLDDLSARQFTLMPGGYWRTVVYSTGTLEVVGIIWPAGAASPLHGHGDSTALLRILSRELLEERFVGGEDGLEFQRTCLSETGFSTLQPGAFHRVVALTEAVGVHVYDPPLLEPTVPVPPTQLPDLADIWRRSPLNADSNHGLPHYLRDAGI